MEIILIILCLSLTTFLIWHFRKPRNTPIPYMEAKAIKTSIKNTMTIPIKTNYNHKIEAVTVCVGYADFLRWTLPFNLHQFNKIVIVTTPEDLETQNICEYWGVHCVTTNCFYDNGDTFNKAKGINFGLKYLSKDAWVIHLDADIYLPPKTRDVLNLLKLNPQTIYSIDRMNCKSFTDWMLFLENPEMQHGYDGLLRQDSFEKGVRLLNLDRDGFVGIGFFQMWNPHVSGVYSYPDTHGSADRTDVLFSYEFTRENRQLLPEIVAVHLESEDCAAGTNWNGRKSKRFGLS